MNWRILGGVAIGLVVGVVAMLLVFGAAFNEIFGGLFQ
jgi:hypothetical protein